MESSAGHRMQISDVQYPNIKGPPDDIMQMLHDSLVDIRLMRWSIQIADVYVERGREAAIEGRDLLARLKAQGL
jgi:hypothetical protein